MIAITCMEVYNVDETSQKIIDATMNLVRDKGYVASTTREIAKLAGVNECTIFRKFKNKKEIIIKGVEQEKWRGNLTSEALENITWDMETDLEMFMTEYMNRITPDFVRLSIGLRAPQIYEETEPLIMQIPHAFISALIKYFELMEHKGKIPHMDFERFAMIIFSSTFGFTFLDASFDKKLTKIEKSDYIKNAVKVFIRGMPKA